MSRMGRKRTLAICLFDAPPIHLRAIPGSVRYSLDDKPDEKAGRHVCRIMGTSWDLRSGDQRGASDRCCSIFRELAGKRASRSDRPGAVPGGKAGLFLGRVIAFFWLLRAPVPGASWTRTVDIRLDHIFDDRRSLMRDEHPRPGANQPV